MTDNKAETRWLITGAAGRIGSALRPRLRRPGRVLRLLDIVPPEPAEPDEAVEIVQASLTDQAAVADVCGGVDAIVHLGGHAGERTWEEILAVNVDGSRCLLEGAREHGVRSVVLASSGHAVGAWTRADARQYGDAGLPADIPARPDTYYGWSKAAMEGLGHLYADRFGMSVTCLRIGAVPPRPNNLRGLAIWLSYDDAARLVEAAIAADKPGVRYVWGISRNTRRWWSLAQGEAIGYYPVDDSEAYAAELAECTNQEPEDNNRVGGPFLDRPLGQSWS